jgi:hypothetical protein
VIILFDQAAINPLDLALGPALPAGLKPLSTKRNHTNETMR